MVYMSLAKLFHTDSSPDRYKSVADELERRRNADSSFKSGVFSGEDEMFIALPRELSVMNERILSRESQVKLVLSGLPPVAYSALIRSLVIDEVVCTNALEGVHSTRRQIGELLERMGAGDSRNRFAEFAKLYLGLAHGDAQTPRSPRDIRAIYDKVMDGESLGANAPDGELFRAHGVDIIGSGGRIVHSGLNPESAIAEALEKMLLFSSDSSVPRLYRALASHYIFEYVHPFYDGNGRTGRYLLSLNLMEPLSIATTLSLSRVIAKDKESYYRSFKLTDDPLNHGELTFFVIAMMAFIEEAQDEIIIDLRKKLDQLESIVGLAEALVSEKELGKNETTALLQLLQVSVFGLSMSVSLDEVADNLGMGNQMARKYMKRLEEMGLAVRVGTHPVRFAISKELAGRFLSESAEVER